MDMAFSCRKNAFFQAPIKLAQPFPAPELRAENFTDTRISLKKTKTYLLFPELRQEQQQVATPIPTADGLSAMSAAQVLCEMIRLLTRTTAFGPA